MMNWNKNDTKYILKRLILYFLITGIVFFAGQRCAKALTLEGWQSNYSIGSNNYTYNAFPDAFKYNGEWFNTNSSNEFAYVGINYLKTNNINFYFNNPCGQGEQLSYNHQIVFYKIGTLDLPYNAVRVINGIEGCTGSWNFDGSGNLVYNETCALQSGPPRTSLYFNFNDINTDWIEPDYTYRIGIKDFNVTCQINSGAIIENNNTNTQNIINNNNNNTQQIIDSNSEINNSINEQTQWQQEDFDVDISQVNAVTDLISTGDKNQIRDLLMFPARILMIVGGHISSNHCDSFNLGSLYGANLVLPCINWKQYVGNDLYNTIDIILSIGIYIGLIIYIRKLLDYVFSLGQTGFNSVNVEVFN